MSYENQCDDDQVEEEVAELIKCGLTDKTASSVFGFYLTLFFKD